MKFPNYLADAEASFKEGDYIIFGVPYDKTGSFRKGTRKAPYAIRQASWNFESYDLLNEVDLQNLDIHDYGDLEIAKDEESSEMKKKVKDFVFKILDENKLPLALGGEHTITYPIIDAFNQKRNDFGVVVLDAHLDFKDVYENNHESHACVIRRVSELIGVENIAVIGVRSGIKDEFDEAKKNNLFFINSFDINKNGIKWAIKKVLDKFDKKQIYLTLDIDAIDPSFAPGTSTPEPFGLTAFDVLDCIESFSKRLIGFDLVEVCPPYDRGETAILAARSLRYLISEISLKQYG